MIMGLLVRLRMGELTKCINPDWGEEERGKDPSRNGDECMYV